MLLKDMSETEIIRSFSPLLPVGEYTELGSGDDCAIVRAPGNQFVVTTDVLVEGRHFRSDWSTGGQIGARAAAQNLADVAAMGATPTSLVVSLVLPPEMSLEWLLDLVGGMAGMVAPTGAGIVGGDLSTGDQLVIAVTAHGTCAGAPVLRSGARAGDTLAVVGTLGRSAAGFAAISTGRVGGQLQGQQVPVPFTEPVQIYRTPQPPLAAGPLAAQRGATAMMDLSDGLVVDAGRIAAASNVQVNLNRDSLGPDVRALKTAGSELGVDPLEWVLYGGEDHSLLVTFPPYTLVTEPFRMIGTVGAADMSGVGVTLDGTPVSGGWDHFSN